MFNSLSEKLDKALHVLKGHGSITEINVAETLKEVRRALLDADVNYKIAKDNYGWKEVSKPFDRTFRKFGRGAARATHAAHAQRRGHPQHR